MATMYDLNKESGAVSLVITNLKYDISATWTSSTAQQYYVVGGTINNPVTGATYVVEVTDGGSNSAYVYVDTTVSSNYAFATTFIPTTIEVYQKA